MKGFFGKTTQRDPDGVSRFSRPRKSAEREPSAGTSAMSQACVPGGHCATLSTSGPNVWRRTLRNSGVSPRAKAAASPGRENFAQGVCTP